MWKALRETYVPLLSLFVFVMGTGFFSTLLIIVMNQHHASTASIGSMTGIFYLGIMFGSFRVEKFISRVGHIRAYSAFSSALAIFCLLHGVFYDLSFWLLLRFLTGFATAGLFVVIESWLLCRSDRLNRGQILALYMITFYAAQSLGQFFLNLNNGQDILLFAISSMLCSLSIIPLSMSYVQSPFYDEPSTLKFSKLLKQSASGLLGCLTAGMMMGSIYGLLPLYLNDIFHTNAAIAKYMFAVIFGGMLLQYPVGKLSDVIERRLVLIGISFATIAVSIMAMLTTQSPILFFSLMMLFGGFTFTVYPISISHACDTLDNKDIVAGTQTLLLAYSVGAAVGPLITPVFMLFSSAEGFFAYFIFINIALIPLFIMRKAQKANTPQEDSFISVPHTSPIISELDPRGE